MKYDNLNFEEYLTKKESLIVEQMIQIHEEIMVNVDTENKDFQEVWEDIIKSAINYTTIRAEWNYLDNEQKAEKDPSRTMIHNTILNNFIVLERIFKLNSWNSNSWTKELFLQGEIENRTRQDISEHRQRIGDFANYLTFVYAINGR